MIDKAKLHQALGLIAEGSSANRAACLLWMPSGTLSHWLARVRAHGGDIDAACLPRKMGRPRKTPPSAL